MTKLDPTVKKETAYIAVWVIALSLGMQAVFLLLRRWALPVVTGNLVGAVCAIGNFLLLGITVAKAANGPADKVALRVRSSMTARLLGQAAICALAVGLLHTNVYATLLPLLFPRVGIAFRPLVDRKRGKTAETEAEGSDLLD
ncbi:MAG: hypothetical protein IJ188_06985 [Clostridia bacterium]|nr:hypothetical protein [Clostridia bacterium]